MACISFINHESHRTIEAGNQQKAVDERHMIGNEQCSAFTGDVVLSDHGEAVQDTGQKGNDEPKQAFRQQPDDDQGSDQCEDGTGEQDIAGRQAKLRE
jgi:hypothetical protein